MWTSALSSSKQEIRHRPRRLGTRIAGGLVAIGAVLGSAPGLGAQEVPSSLAWLTGCWRAGSETSWTEEVWSSEVGGVMLGYARSVRDGQVRNTEFLRLEQTAEGWVYQASPSGQSTTRFPSVVASEGQLDVRAPEHDFPQRIHYERRAADRVVASVYGAVGDASPAFALDYRRIPCEP